MFIYKHRCRTSKIDKFWLQCAVGYESAMYRMPNAEKKHITSQAVTVLYNILSLIHITCARVVAYLYSIHIYTQSQYVAYIYEYIYVKLRKCLFKYHLVELRLYTILDSLFHQLFLLFIVSKFPSILCPVVPLSYSCQVHTAHCSAYIYMIYIVHIQRTYV